MSWPLRLTALNSLITPLFGFSVLLWATLLVTTDIDFAVRLADAESLATPLEGGAASLHVCLQRTPEGWGSERDVCVANSA